MRMMIDFYNILYDLFVFYANTLKKKFDGKHINNKNEYQNLSLVSTYKMTVRHYNKTNIGVD